jgi:hypothetical protein
MTDNIALLRQRLRRLRRKLTRQVPGSNGYSQTEALINKAATRIKNLDGVNGHD